MDQARIDKIKKEHRLERTPLTSWHIKVGGTGLILNAPDKEIELDQEKYESIEYCRTRSIDSDFDTKGKRVWVLKFVCKQEQVSMILSRFMIP